MNTEDDFTNECIADYVAALLIVSELDDVAFRKIREAIEDAEETDGGYSVASIPRKLDYLEFKTLEDCVLMGSFALTNAGYLYFENGTYRPQVFFPEAFVKARKTFRRLYSRKFKGKDKWITNLTAKQLLGFDLLDNEKIASKKSGPTSFPKKHKDGEDALNLDPSESLKLLEKECPAARKLIQLFDLESQ